MAAKKKIGLRKTTKRVTKGVKAGAPRMGRKLVKKAGARKRIAKD